MNMPSYIRLSSTFLRPVLLLIGAASFAFQPAQILPFKTVTIPDPPPEDIFAANQADTLLWNTKRSVEVQKIGRHAFCQSGSEKDVFDPSHVLVGRQCTVDREARGYYGYTLPPRGQNVPGDDPTVKISSDQGFKSGLVAKPLQSQPFHGRPFLLDCDDTGATHRVTAADGTTNFQVKKADQTFFFGANVSLDSNFEISFTNAGDAAKLCPGGIQANDFGLLCTLATAAPAKKYPFTIKSPGTCQNSIKFTLELK